MKEKLENGNISSEQTSNPKKEEGNKLKRIIVAIGKKQLDRFKEKSADHFPGTNEDVYSDSYDWSFNPTPYWTKEVDYHFQKWKLYSQNRYNTTKEGTAIIDLINVLTLLYFSEFYGNYIDEAVYFGEPQLGTDQVLESFEGKEE